ncbi:right-handed parallel beta-helix repeat-containing protein [Methanoculleus horonobensis]|uniref:right-handed parallel beta-helix repeat-containing protein n=1 Tax=Methanoculleus horonobensis TaxID=528314 RepID=UPI000837A177|nr:right-handed parallel beta-helix repeat-containing protein [Methanoculleus horonobensis]
MKVTVRKIIVTLMIAVVLWGSGPGSCSTAAEQPPVLVIAANDSSEQSRSRADVICDGFADEVEIGLALGEVSPGGKVILTEGTFHCNKNLHFEPHTTLEGQGENQTYLNCSGECPGVVMDDENLTIRGLTITNRGGILITKTAHIRVHQVVVDSPHLYQDGAFSMWMNADETLEDIEFIDCKALNVPGFGYWTCGQGPGQVQRNVRYINCQAIGCGGGDGASSETTRLWSGGFSLQETNAAEDILVKGCYAEGNWQSGFHQEPSNPTQNFTIEDCISVNNGQKARYVENPDTLDGSPDMVFGAGYFLGTNATLRNCTADGNYHGVELWWGQGCTVENCTSRNSQAEDYFLVYGSGRSIPNTFRNCVSDHAGMHALSAEVGTKNAYFTNFTVIDPQGDGMYNLMIGGNLRANDDSAGHDPCEDSYFDIRFFGGGSPAALGVERGRNLTFTGTIETDQPNPIFIDGWDTESITIERMHISIESENEEAAGITVVPAVVKAGTIRIADSTIIDPRPVTKLQYGIKNIAQEQVVVSNLTVTGAATPCSHCNITVEATEAPQDISIINGTIQFLRRFTEIFPWKSLK